VILYQIYNVAMVCGSHCAFVRSNKTGELLEVRLTLTALQAYT